MDAPLPTPSRTLGDRYELTRELGRGGAAIVFLARDTTNDAVVAAKVLRPEFAYAVGRDRFLQEIAIVSRLSHPRIVPITDSGETDGSLWYIMPCVGGGSLRTRLVKEKQLAIDFTTRLGAQVAEALAHAHAAGIVHRDVKPENILLDGDDAYLADFGIARGIDAATAERLTSSGIAIGTPAYMSPEQGGASRDVDGHSDVYSLACVLYESLAGVPPYVGPTPQSVIAQRYAHAPWPLASFRPTVPGYVQAAIEKAMALTPVDRGTAEEFGRALRDGGLTTPASPRVTAATRRRGRRTIAALSLAAGAGALMAVPWIRHLVTTTANSSASSTSTGTRALRVAILPFNEESNLAPGLSGDQLLHDAFAWWNGIEVIEQVLVRDQLARHGEDSRPGLTMQAVARALSVDRIVRSEVSRTGDLLRVHAALYEISNQQPIKVSDGSAVLPLNGTGADSAFRGLAEQLLVGRAGQVDDRGAPRETASLPARIEFLKGLAAIREWDLGSADSAFARALRLDHDYARAELWLAQIRGWTSDDPLDWSALAQRANAGRASIPPGERQLASALAALSAGDFPTACAAYLSIVSHDARAFPGWFGLGECRRRDQLVVRDARSPSGWRFRSSIREGMDAYRRAFELLPSSNLAFRANAFTRLNTLFLTSMNAQAGFGAPPTHTLYAALPDWDIKGDSLLLVPYTLDRFATIIPSHISIALRRNREVMRGIARSWVAAYPNSGDAHELLGVATEVFGDRSSLDDITRARALASTRADRIRLTALQIWLTVKFGLNQPPEIMAQAAALADSLMASIHGTVSRDEASWLAGVAALTGRLEQAASYCVVAQCAGGFTDLSNGDASQRDIVDALSRLQIFAAAGVPADTIRSLVSTVKRMCERLPLDAVNRESACHSYLQYPRALLIASSMIGLLGPPDPADPLATAAEALDVGDSSRARRALDQIRATRQSTPGSEFTIDAVVAEAWMISRAQDAARGAKWLDASLNTYASSAPAQIQHPTFMISLVRALALRGSLARLLGDEVEANRRRAQATSLWMRADPVARRAIDAKPALATASH